MSPRITGEEAAEILRDLARGREDGNGADVWPLYDRAEDAMAAVVALAADLAAERTRADAAEAQHAELAGAVRAEREALSAEWDAASEHHSEMWAETYYATKPPARAATARLTALLAAAPPRSTVDARVVQEYLAAEAQYETARNEYTLNVGLYVATCAAAKATLATARATLGAALAGCSP